MSVVDLTASGVLTQGCLDLDLTYEVAAVPKPFTPIHAPNTRPVNAGQFASASFGDLAAGYAAMAPPVFSTPEPTVRYPSPTNANQPQRLDTHTTGLNH